MTRRDLSWITKTYFYDFDDLVVINSGWCYIWAWLAKLAHPEAQLYVHDEAEACHAFVKIGSLYYDSSQPKGVRAIKALDFFEEFEIHTVGNSGIFKCSPEAYKELWQYRGGDWSTQKLSPWPLELPVRPDLDHIAEWAK